MFSVSLDGKSSGDVKFPTQLNLFIFSESVRQNNVNLSVTENTTVMFNSRNTNFNGIMGVFPGKTDQQRISVTFEQRNPATSGLLRKNIALNYQCSGNDFLRGLFCFSMMVGGGFTSYTNELAFNYELNFSLKRLDLGNSVNVIFSKTLQGRMREGNNNIYFIENINHTELKKGDIIFLTIELRNRDGIRSFNHNPTMVMDFTNANILFPIGTK